MVFTKSQKKKVLEHIIKDVFGFGDDHNIVKILRENNIDTIMDLIVLRIKYLKLFTFMDDPGNQQTLMLGHIAQLFTCPKGSSSFIHSRRLLISTRQLIGIPLPRTTSMNGISVKMDMSIPSPLQHLPTVLA
jgi:hypothetical protein